MRTIILLITMVIDTKMFLSSKVNKKNQSLGKSLRQSKNRMSIYMVFSDNGAYDIRPYCPSRLHYIGTNLDTIDLKKMSDDLFDDDDDDINYYIIYICKFDLENGGLNMDQSLVGEYAEPDLIKQNNIFEGNFIEFVEEIESLAPRSRPRPRPQQTTTRNA